MAQDSEQQPIRDDGPDPQYPYGATPQIPQEASAPLSYLSPEFYTAHAPTPIQQPEVESGYTVPTPDAYIPSLDTRTIPQSPYGSYPSYTPPQRQYGERSGYGHGGQSQRYGDGYDSNIPPSFAIPQSTPLPLGEAIRQLPAQYWRVIRRPSSMTFATEMGKASWNIVWVQIVFYTIIVTILGVLSSFIVPANTSSLSTTNTSTLTPETLAIVQKLQVFLSYATTYGQILLIPLFVFTGTGILFLLAKAFGGRGKFLSQLYSTLLFIVPLGLIVNILVLLLSLLPTLGSFLALLVALGNLGYEGTLLGLMLMPVHRLSRGRAAGSILLLFGVALLLSCVVGIIIATIFAATIQPT